MPPRRLAALLAAALALAAVPHAAAPLAAQAPRRHAIAVGYSPAAGLVGAEWVGWARGARVGGAAGAGLGGAGGRVNARVAGGARRVAYAGLGAAALPWLPGLGTRGVVSVEGGVQFWPAPGRRFYADVGAGVARLWWEQQAPTVGPVLRLMLGRAL